ncbi:hypothetical protein NPIL_70611 [Nephila pilipes]|uniref:Uncharacterized protein n=1 Tax=Nephila pilipes TaxID=299642 RepID=A0A8X6UNJ5_NEPPI|nr:hypothetical protein NPIL_70611 [Nephila pilipes]
MAKLRFTPEKSKSKDSFPDFPKEGVFQGVQQTTAPLSSKRRAKERSMVPDMSDVKGTVDGHKKKLTTEELKKLEKEMLNNNIYTQLHTAQCFSAHSLPPEFSSNQNVVKRLLLRDSR